MRRQLNESDLLRMKLPKSYWECTFDGIAEENQEIILNYLRKVLSNDINGVGFLFWGDNGRGKTGILSVIGKEFKRNGYQVLFLEASDIKRIVMKDIQFDDMVSIWDRARDVTVLLLDDLGKGVMDNTGFGARLIDELIRHRTSENLVTLISTNMTPEQMLMDFKKSTIHSLKSKIIPVQILGDDKREGLKEELITMFF